MRNELSRYLEAPFAGFTRQPEFFHDWVPALDVLEDHDNLIVRAELPGMKKDDIEISIQEGVLSITGERKEEKEASGEAYRAERFFGRFHRAITLPKAVAVEKVKANYKDGVLSITLPKTEEAKPRQIQVTTA